MVFSQFFATNFIDLSSKADFTELDKIYSIVLDKIDQHIPITSSFFRSGNLGNLKLRGDIGKKVELLRVVEIGEYDKNACGGTHIENTDEIDSFVITKIDGKRIKFTTGKYARKFQSKIISSSHQLSKLLGTPIDQIYEKSYKLFIINLKCMILFHL